MSLLDRWNQIVLVYPEEFSISRDGNKMVKASTAGIEKRVMIQAMPQSGTSARRAEQDNEGYETEQNYRMRFVRGDEVELGPASRIQWRGQFWSVNGFPIEYNSGRRTAHTDYVIRRN